MDSEILTLQVDINDDPMNQKVDEIEERISTLKKNAEQTSTESVSTSVLPGYNQAFEGKLSEWQKDLDNIVRVRNSMDHALSSYEREDLSNAFKRKVEVANASIKDLTNSQSLAQQLLDSLGPQMSQVFSEGLKGIVSQLSTGIRTTASTISSTVSRKLTDDEIVDRYMTGDEYRKISQRLAQANPSHPEVFSNQNMRQYLKATLPMNVPQYMREAVTGGTQVQFRTNPGSFREMLPESFRQIPAYEKASDYRSLGSTQYGSATLSREEIDSLSQLVRNNRYAADAAVKAGVIAKSGQKMYFNHDTTHDMVNAMAGHIMSDIVSAAQGERKYGITDVEDPRSWKNIFGKIGANNILDGGLQAARAMQDAFGTWLNPGYYKQKGANGEWLDLAKFDATSDAGEYIGRINHSPRKTSRAFAEYTLDMMEGKAQISGYHPIIQKGGQWVELSGVTGPTKKGEVDINGQKINRNIAPSDFHTMSLRDSLLYKLIESTPSASKVGQNEFSDNAIYLKYDKELSDPNLTEKQRQQYIQRYGDLFKNGYDANGHHYINTRIGKTHAEFIRSDIIDDLGRRVLGAEAASKTADEIREAGLTLLTNGGGLGHFDKFQPFAKSMYSRSNMATEGESLESWLGAKKDLKVVVGRFGESDMDGSNWISDRVSNKGFQGRTFGGKATYVPIKMEDLRFKNYKQIEGNEETEARVAELNKETEARVAKVNEKADRKLARVNKYETDQEEREARIKEIEDSRKERLDKINAQHRTKEASIMNQYGGDLIIPNAGVNGGDLRISKDTDVIEDINNIKYSKNVGPRTQEEWNAIRSQEYGDFGVSAKTTYDDANTSSRWLSKQVINSSMNAGFRDPRVQRFFDKTFFDELARLDNDQYVRDALFNGDQSVDLTTAESKKVIDDHIAGMWAHYNEGDKLLPTGVFKYAMAAPNPQNVINNRLKEAKIALTPEQEALQLKDNDVISMESLNRQLGIIRFPATKSGNVTVNNVSAEQLMSEGAVSAEKINRLARSSGIVDTKGLYFAPNSPILQLLQGEDFDGDLNGYFGLSDKKPEEAKEFSEVMRIIANASDQEVKAVFSGAEPGTPEFQKAWENQNTRKEGRTIRSTPKDGGYSARDPYDAATYLVNGQQQTWMMGSAERSADMAALYYAGLNDPNLRGSLAQAIRDYESQYDVVSTHMKTDESWQQTDEQAAAADLGKSFSRIFKYANEAIETTGANDDSTREWTGKSKAYLEQQKIDSLGLPSVFQGGLMGALSGRWTARQKGIDPDKGLYNWEEILKDPNYGLKLPKGVSADSEQGKFVQMMRGVRSDFLTSKYLVASNDTVAALREQYEKAQKEIENEIDPHSENSAKRKKQRLMDIGGVAFENFEKYGANEAVMNNAPWVSAHFKDVAEREGKTFDQIIGSADFVKPTPPVVTVPSEPQQPAKQEQPKESAPVVSPRQEPKAIVTTSEKLPPQAQERFAIQKPEETTIPDRTVPSDLLKKPEDEARELLHNAGIIDSRINTLLADENRDALLKAVTENNAKGLLSLPGIGKVSAQQAVNALQVSQLASGVKITSPAEMATPLAVVPVPNIEKEIQPQTQTDATMICGVCGTEYPASLGHCPNEANHNTANKPKTGISGKDIQARYSRLSQMNWGDMPYPLPGIMAEMALNENRLLDSSLQDDWDKIRGKNNKFHSILTEANAADDVHAWAKAYEEKQLEEAHKQQEAKKNASSNSQSNNQQLPASPTNPPVPPTNPPNNPPPGSPPTNPPTPPNNPPIPPNNPPVPPSGPPNNPPPGGPPNNPPVPPFTPPGGPPSGPNSWDMVAAQSNYEQIITKAQEFSKNLFGETLKYQRQTEGIPKSIVKADTLNGIALKYERDIKDFIQTPSYSMLTSDQQANLQKAISPEYGLFARAGTEFSELSRLTSSQVLEGITKADAKASGTYDAQIESLNAWDQKIKEVIADQERLLAMSKDSRYSQDLRNQFKDTANKLGNDLKVIQGSRDHLQAATVDQNEKAFNKQIESLENKRHPGGRLQQQSNAYREQISNIRDNLTKKHDSGLISDQAFKDDLGKLDKLEKQTSVSALVMQQSMNIVSKSVTNMLARFGRQMFMKAIQEAKKFVKEFDATMTEIQMITLKTDNQIANLGDRLIDKAKELKISVSEISKSAATLYRQGLSDEEVEERLDVISKFSKVSGTKVDDATKLITVAMNTGLVNNASEASDIVTALGDNAATNAAQIEKGIEKAGAAAAADGTTFGQLAAMLTAITSTTQIGGNVAGRTLNSIFGRMNKVGTNELIYDENGNAVSGSAVAKLLEAQGVRQYDENGNKRSSFDVLYDLSQRWDNISDAEQQQLANAIAGTRMYSNFSAIMQGMSEGDIDKYMDLIGESSGITDKKYEIYTKSLAASMTDLKNIYDELVNDLVTSNIAGDVLGFLSNAIQGVDNLIASGAKLPGVLAGLIPIVSLMVGLKSGSLAGLAIGTAVAGISALGLNIVATNRTETAEERYDRITTAQKSTNDNIANQINRATELKNLGANRTDEETEEYKKILTSLSEKFNIKLPFDDIRETANNASENLDNLAKSTSALGDAAKNAKPSVEEYADHILNESKEEAENIKARNLYGNVSDISAQIATTAKEADNAWFKDSSGLLSMAGFAVNQETGEVTITDKTKTHISGSDKNPFSLPHKNVENYNAFARVMSEALMAPDLSVYDIPTEYIGQNENFWKNYLRAGISGNAKDLPDEVFNAVAGYWNDPTRTKGRNKNLEDQVIPEISKFLSSEDYSFIPEEYIEPLARHIYNSLPSTNGGLIDISTQAIANTIRNVLGFNNIESSSAITAENVVATISNSLEGYTSVIKPENGAYKLETGDYYIDKNNPDRKYTVEEAERLASQLEAVDTAQAEARAQTITNERQYQAQLARAKREQQENTSYEVTDIDGSVISFEGQNAENDANAEYRDIVEVANEEKQYGRYRVYDPEGKFLDSLDDKEAATAKARAASWYTSRETGLVYRGASEYEDATSFDGVESGNEFDIHAGRVVDLEKILTGVRKVIPKLEDIEDYKIVEAYDLLSDEMKAAVDAAANGAEVSAEVVSQVRSNLENQFSNLVAVQNHFGNGLETSKQAWESKNGSVLAADSILDMMLNNQFKDIQDLADYVNENNIEAWDVLNRQEDFAAIMQGVNVDTEGNVISAPEHILDTILTYLYSKSSNTANRTYTNSELAELSSDALNVLQNGGRASYSLVDADYRSALNKYNDEFTQENGALLSYEDWVAKSGLNRPETNWQNNNNIRSAYESYKYGYQSKYNSGLGELKNIDSYIAKNNIKYLSPEQQNALKTVLGEDLYNKAITGQASKEESAFINTTIANRAVGLTSLTSRQQLQGLSSFRDQIGQGVKIGDQEGEYRANIASQYLNGWGGANEYLGLLQAKDKDKALYEKLGGDKRLEELETSLDNYENKLEFQVKIEGLKELEEAGDLLAGTANYVEQLKKGGRFAIEAVVNIRTEMNKEGQLDAKLASGTAAEKREAVMQITGASQDEYYARPEFWTAEAERIRTERRSISAESLKTERNELSESERSNFDAHTAALAGYEWVEGEYTPPEGYTVDSRGFVKRNGKTDANETLRRQNAIRNGHYEYTGTQTRDTAQNDAGQALYESMSSEIQTDRIAALQTQTANQQKLARGQTALDQLDTDKAFEEIDETIIQELTSVTGYTRDQIKAMWGKSSTDAKATLQASITAQSDELNTTLVEAFKLMLGAVDISELGPDVDTETLAKYFDGTNDALANYIRTIGIFVQSGEAQVNKGTQNLYTSLAEAQRAADAKSKTNAKAYGAARQAIFGSENGPYANLTLRQRASLLVNNKTQDLSGIDENLRYMLTLASQEGSGVTETDLQAAYNTALFGGKATDKYGFASRKLFGENGFSNQNWDEETLNGIRTRYQSEIDNNGKDSPLVKMWDAMFSDMGDAGSALQKFLSEGKLPEDFAEKYAEWLASIDFAGDRNAAEKATNVRLLSSGRSSDRGQVLSGYFSDLASVERANIAATSPEEISKQGDIVSLLGLDQDYVSEQMKTSGGQESILGMINERRDEILSNVKDVIEQDLKGVDIDKTTDELEEIDLSEATDFDSLIETLREAATKADDETAARLNEYADTLEGASNAATQDFSQAYQEARDRLRQSTYEFKGSQVLQGMADTYNPQADGDFWDYVQNQKDENGNPVWDSNWTNAVMSNNGIVAAMGLLSNGTLTSADYNQFMTAQMNGAGKDYQYYDLIAQASLGDNYHSGQFNSIGLRETLDKMKGDENLRGFYDEIISKFPELEQAANGSNAALKALNSNWAASKAADVAKYAKGVDGLSETITDLAKGGTDAAQAEMKLTKQMEDLQDQQGAINRARGKSGKQLNRMKKRGDQTLDILAGLLPYDADQLANMSQEKLDELLNQVQPIISQQFSDTVASLFSFLEGTEGFSYNMPIGDLIHVNAEGQLELSEFAAKLGDEEKRVLDVIMSLLGTYASVDIQALLSDGHIDVQSFLSQLGMSGISARPGNSYSRPTTRPSNSGNNGKSATDALLEGQSHYIKRREHDVTMAQERQTRYETTNNYQGYLNSLNDEIEAQLRLKDQYSANIAALESQLSKVKVGSEEWYKLAEAIDSAKESMAKIDNEIDAINSKKINIVETKHANEDKPISHASTMLGLRAQNYLAKGQFENYAAVTQAQIQNYRNDIEMNNYQIEEWEKLLKTYKKGTQDWITVRDNIWKLKEQNAEIENQILTETQNLQQAKISQIATDLQNALEPFSHEQDMLSTWSGIYQKENQYGAYRGALASQNAYSADQLKLYQASIDGLKQQMATLEEGSPAWLSARSAIFEYEAAMAQLTATIRDNNEAIEESYVLETTTQYEDANKSAQHELRMAQIAAQGYKDAGDYENYKAMLDVQRDLTAENLRVKQSGLEAMEELLNSGKLKEGSTQWKALREQIMALREEILQTENDYASIVRQVRETDFSHAVEQFQEQDNNYQHELRLIQFQETRYQNRSELTNYGHALEWDNETQKKRAEAIEEQIDLLEQQRDAAKDDPELYKKIDAEIKKMEETLASTNNTIEKNNKLIEKNQEDIKKLAKNIEDTLDKEIKAQEKMRREMLQGEVNVQNSILNVIKKEKQDEWNLEKKTREEHKKTLQNEKNLINERLNARKAAIDAEDKYELLAEYQKQLALISMDPTRSKDAKELRRQISDLQKELSWNITEDEAQAAMDALDDEIQAEDDYIQVHEEDLKELLENSGNFMDQVKDIMGNSYEDYDQYLAWMKEHNEDYKNSSAEMQQSMEQGWKDTWDKMYGHTDTYWDQIMGLMSNKEEFLDFMKQSQDYMNASENGKWILEHQWSTAYDNYAASLVDNAEFADNHEILDKMSEMKEWTYKVEPIPGYQYDYGQYATTGPQYFWTRTPDDTTGVAQAAVDESYDKYSKVVGSDAELYKSQQEEKPVSTPVYIVTSGGGGSTTTYGGGGGSNPPKNTPSPKKHYEFYWGSKRYSGYNSWNEATTALKKIYDQERALLDRSNANAYGYRQLEDFYKRAQGTVKQYKHGGKIDFTGLAWVDGTKSQPESILSAYDTKALMGLTEALRYVSVSPSLAPDTTKYGNNTSIGDINITINQAELKDDADYEDVARRVGKAFTKQLNKEGFNLARYAF